MSGSKAEPRYSLISNVHDPCDDLYPDQDTILGNTGKCCHRDLTRSWSIGWLAVVFGVMLLTIFDVVAMFVLFSWSTDRKCPEQWFTPCMTLDVLC